MIFDNKAEDFVLINYVLSGTDEYGDNTYTKNETQIKGIIQRHGQQQLTTDEGGELPETGIRLYVKDDVNVQVPTEDTPRSSVVKRELTGNEYVIESIFNEGNGLIRCECDDRN